MTTINAKYFFMKTKLHFSIFMLFACIFTYAQETTVDLSMGAGYANQVYYKLSTETENSFEASSWDIAFLSTSVYSQAMIANHSIGVLVFEASSDISEWDTIDVADESSWTQLYNSDTERANGAFNQGSATYGWGEYDVVSHAVSGSIIFILKYADGSYKKFMCEDYTYGVYNIKYASWDDETSTWGEDKTAAIDTSASTDTNYDYYSLQNEEHVVAEPASTDWDLFFGRYVTDLGGGTMYLVSGVLHADGVEVAETTATNTTTDLDYSIYINTMGYDWKAYNSDIYSFVVDSDTHYYVKDTDENIFKMYFTEFAGSSTGDVQFVFEDVTATLDIEEVGQNVSFGIYPNPLGASKTLNVIFDINTANQDDYRLEIYSLSGQKVYQEDVANSLGFYNKQLDLSNLSQGVYLLNFKAGNYNTSKKIIIQ